MDNFNWLDLFLKIYTMPLPHEIFLTQTFHSPYLSQGITWYPKGSTAPCMNDSDWSKAKNYNNLSITRDPNCSSLIFCSPTFLSSSWPSSSSFPQMWLLPQSFCLHELWRLVDSTWSCNKAEQKRHVPSLSSIQTIKLKGWIFKCKYSLMDWQLNTWRKDSLRPQNWISSSTVKVQFRSQTCIFPSLRTGWLQISLLCFSYF